jgi:molybdopterin-guanine dinucleotide biosynthesis adapter protein
MNTALSIVGFKKSGKTTLVLDLIRELKKREVKVSAAKFSHHSFDRQNTDTGNISKEAVDLAGISESETFFCWSGKKYLPDLVPLMSGDVLLVEGGKGLGWLPRVLTLKSPEEAVKLDNGLALATFGRVRTDYLPHLDSVAELADLMLEKGFMLPGLDCGSCGHETCSGLAAQIVSGTAGPGDCLARGDSLEIKINGKSLGMNPFVERVISKSILGMLSELKGYSPGKVEISIAGR